jgi:hypothetical protein
MQGDVKTWDNYWGTITALKVYTRTSKGVISYFLKADATFDDGDIWPGTPLEELSKKSWELPKAQKMQALVNPSTRHIGDVEDENEECSQVQLLLSGHGESRESTMVISRAMYKL